MRLSTTINIFTARNLKDRKYSTVKNKSGFTFIEILIAVSIIGFLASIGVVSYSSAQKKSRDGKRKADLEAIRSALEMYRADEGNYPSTGNLSDLETDYIQSIPDDPKDPTYTYAYNSSGSTYCLGAYLEGGGGSSCGAGDCAFASGACVSDCNYCVQNP